MYASNSAVVDLRPNNFDNLVLNSDHIWVVEFYAPWCGHCQQLMPEYDKAATALKVCVVLYHVINFSEYIVSFIHISIGHHKSWCSKCR